MIFIKDTELKNIKQNNIITAISSDDPTIVNEIELSVIDEIISYLGGIYNTDLIFSQKDNNRSPIIKRLVLQMMFYQLSLRIVSDDIPSYLETQYQNNIEFLKNAASGKLNLNLPLIDSRVEQTLGFIGESTPNFYN